MRGEATPNTQDIIVTVEDFILVCRLRNFHFTANWVEKRYYLFLRTLSPEIIEHLKRRKQA